VIGLPSLQAMEHAQGARIWMASEATDIRCGFHRLAERVRAVIGENPQSGHLFVFRLRRGASAKDFGLGERRFVLWFTNAWMPSMHRCSGGGVRIREQVESPIPPKVVQRTKSWTLLLRVE
jgi:transposase